MNKFHIITPCYNHQEYLDKCIGSIESQDYPKELVSMTIIDDSSKFPLKTKETSFNLKIIRNNERMHPAYNRYLVYSKVKNDEIILFLDGDDWLSDNKCLSTISRIYKDNDINWAISNHKIYKNNKIKVIPSFVTLPLIIDKPKICHLRSGYGYVWNNMEEDWIKYKNNYIKWMTDWNENIYAIKNFGQPYKIESSLSVYNQDTSKTRKENKNYIEMINFFKNK
jgi:glycosyltransferase involved in cell wall biosynthesis